MSRNRVAALIFAGVGVVLAGVTALLGLEAYLLWTGQAPITWYETCIVNAHPVVSYFVVAVLAGGIASLFAHFFWSKSIHRQP